MVEAPDAALFVGAARQSKKSMTTCSFNRHAAPERVCNTAGSVMLRQAQRAD